MNDTIEHHPHFAPTYAVARERFRQRAMASGAKLDARVHPDALGPAAEPLSIDLARLGPTDSERLLVIISGTHGVEGFAGSAIQCALLERWAEAPPTVGVLLVHALNPFGFAHIRRVNEDNVDLNRNFLPDHGAPPPDPGYSALHHLLLPSDWTGPGRTAADAELMQRAHAEGPRALQMAVTTGQYGHPDGMYFGGNGPAWSNRCLRRIIEREVAGVAQVGVIDIHTGLGPAGHGEILFSGAPDGPECRRAQAWYGADEVAIEQLGDAISPPLHGEMPTAFDAAAEKGSAVTRITLEFGTVEPMVVLQSLRAEHWAWNHGQFHRPDGRAIKAALRAAFELPTPAWRAAVLGRGHAVVDRALAGLATG